MIQDLLHTGILPAVKYFIFNLISIIIKVFSKFRVIYEVCVIKSIIIDKKISHLKLRQLMLKPKFYYSNNSNKQTIM